MKTVLRSRGLARRTAALGAATVLVLGAAACGSAKESSGGGGASSGASGGTGVTVDKGFKVGLLLPENKTARYEKFDKPFFEQKMRTLCPKCEVQYANAQQQASTQQQQAEAMLTNGVNVLVLDAVDTKAAAAIVDSAKAKGVPVIAYDRLAQGPINGYVSFDNTTVGKIQGTSLLEGLKKGGDPKRGSIIMINGSPTDPNAGEFKSGAHSVLDNQVVIGREYDTPDWSNDKAQSETEQAITALGGPGKVIGAYSANDGMAGGVIAALKAANFNPVPPVTGQDAELAAIQRILTGDQYMTVFKPYQPEADTAADMAVAAATGKKFSGDLTTKNNGTLDVSAIILNPQPVTKSNVKDTVAKPPYYSVAEICTPDYAAACKAAGLT
ncbi:substrate-binding domain-containing protein [Yinghuangia seranimata]|uniref:substrate-binding domain-containing protein n=1 Tax=Yinghuangia seranimata TaxID=408067 RepID=UPI00248BCF9D|nr:substrate-binding domain-containing protein [Yinghuangia seranimata]MDI2132175.1 substrate-binding domain-containing protein [Yinghuangia seranimata]